MRAMRAASCGSATPSDGKKKKEKRKPAKVRAVCRRALTGFGDAALSVAGSGIYTIFKIELILVFVKNIEYNQDMCYNVFG